MTSVQTVQCTVLFRYTSYMPNQPVPLQYKRVDHFGAVFGPFRYIMKSDCKKTLNGIWFQSAIPKDRHSERSVTLKEVIHGRCTE